MIYLILFAFFTSVSFFELNVEGRHTKLNLAALYSFLTIFLIVMAGTRTIGFDYSNYLYLYDVITLDNYLENTVEIGYAFLTQISRNLNLSFHTFLLFIALLGVGWKMHFIFKWSQNWFLSLTYYFAIGFTINEMGQIRHGLAIAIILLAFSDLFDKNYKKFFFKTFFAFLIHASALIVFPVYFLLKAEISPKKLLAATLPFFIFVFVDLKAFIEILIEFLPITHVQAKLSYYILSEEYGNRLGFNISLILRLIFLLVLYVYYDTGKKKFYYYDSLYKLYWFGVILYMLFNSIGDLAIRSSLYFKTIECLILPIIVCLGKTKVEKNLLCLLMVLYSFWSLYKIVFDPSFSASYLPYESILY